MFEGAYGLLRNPAGHGPTGLGVIEAAETVLEADPFDAPFGSRRRENGQKFVAHPDQMICASVVS